LHISYKVFPEIRASTQLRNFMHIS